MLRSLKYIKYHNSIFSMKISVWSSLFPILSLIHKGIILLL